jgi:L-fucose isomerase-like protein
MPVNTDKTTFALFFGTRAGFPASLMASARSEMSSALKAMGHNILVMDESATPFGAVCSPAEGAIYAKWLRENEGKFGGIIVCLPNFGDENGAAAALRHAGVPIFIQAYPDEMDKMRQGLRRDAFCGKLSIMDVFRQYGIKFTAVKPHTVSPSSEVFADSVDYFDRVCRVVNGVREMSVGAIGARVTPFKTVRIDELALQRHGITVETFDLSEVFDLMGKISESDSELAAKMARLKAYADFSTMPADKFDTLSRLSVVIDRIVAQNGLDTVAVRCWMEMQSVLGISPCVLLSEMNDRGLIASCEVDIGNAVAMRAASLASGDVSACMDWNNNYGDDEDKCILFHCGPVPQGMMKSHGKVTEHGIIGNVLPPECTFGCNVGRMKPGPFTFTSMMSENGNLRFYVGEGEITDDKIADDFFGCAGVVDIPNLQDVLLHVGYQGHRHHVSITPGNVAAPMIEALEYYLGHEVSLPQEL